MKRPNIFIIAIAVAMPVMGMTIISPALSQIKFNVKCIFGTTASLHPDNIVHHTHNQENKETLISPWKVGIGATSPVTPGVTGAVRL